MTKRYAKYERKTTSFNWKTKRRKYYPKPGNGADEKKEELDAIQLKFTKKSAVFRLKCWIAEEGKGAKIRGIVSNSLLTAVFFLCIILVIMSSC